MGAHQNRSRHGFFAACLALGFTTFSASSALALSPVGGGGGGGTPTTPVVSPAVSPGLPYISDRLGGAQQSPSSAPTGTVVPDDFCIPGKLDICGDHLRDAPEAFDDGPIFVGNEDLAFSQANNSAWVDVAVRRTDIASLSESHETTSYSVGVDRKFGDRFVFGVMAVSSQNSVLYSLTGIEDQSNGIFAGPYFSVRLSDNVFLDGRYYLGSSDHVVATAGAQTGLYQSQNSFAALRFSADIQKGNWRILPSLELAQITQDSDAYTDSIRGLIASSVSSQTFITASALGYYSGFQNITPYIGMDVSSETGSSELSATIRTGATMVFGNGATLNLDYAYGGIGLAGTDDQQISLRFEFPF